METPGDFMKGRADYSKAQLSRHKHSFCKDKSYIWHSTHRISNLVQFDFGSRQAGDTDLGKVSFKMELAGYFMEMPVDFCLKRRRKLLRSPLPQEIAYLSLLANRQGH
jgi:hypothetical protein